MKWSVALLAFLVLAAPARAELITQGSDLQAPADTFESHPRDWAAWPLAYGSQPGAATTVEQQGEVVLARLKGKLNTAATGEPIPTVVMHVVVMRPQPDGTAELMVSTADMTLPTTGDPQQINDYLIQDTKAQPGQFGYARICVQRGDYVALATSGGYGPGGYPDGVQFQMFSTLPGAAVALFEEPEGQGNFYVGDRERGAEQPRRELLMQVVIGTREHARYTCRTDAEKAEGLPNPGEGTTPPPGPGDPTPAAKGVAAPTKASKARKNKVTITLRCDGPGACAGTLELSNNKTVYGTAPYVLAEGASGNVKITLNKAARKKLKQGRGKVTVRARTRSATKGVKSGSAVFKVKKA